MATSLFRLMLIGLLLRAIPSVAAPFAYIPNADGNSASVIDTDTNTVVDTITGLGHPFAVAVHPNGRKVYIAGASNGVVHVIDAFTNKVIKNVPIPGTSFSFPWGLAVTPDGSRVYANNGIDAVSVIDTSTDTVTTSIPVTAPGFTLQGLNINAAGTRAYTADVFSGTVSVIDTTTNTLIAAPIAGTRFAIPNLAGTKVYGFEYGSNSVSILDASTNLVTGSIQLPFATCTSPSGGTFDPSGTKLFISCGNSSRIAVIDPATDTYVTDFAVGFVPFGLDFLPDGSLLYVNLSGDNTVRAVDPTTYATVATIPVGDEPHSDGKFIGPDFVCGNSTIDPGEGCDDGNFVGGDGCSSTCKGEHDTVISAPKPLTIKIKNGVSSAEKAVKVKIVNADISPAPETPGHEVVVTASSDCPAVTINSIDYGGGSSTGTIAGGGSAKIKLNLLITSIATTFNKKAPTRCRVTVAANAVPAFAMTDPYPSNNTATFDVNIIDQNDVETTTSTVHETALTSVKPLQLKIGLGSASVAKTIKAKAINADYLPVGEVASLHSISLTALDGTCAASTVGSATIGGAASIDVAGGKSSAGAATATLQASSVTSPNPLSPARCRVMLSANGPGGDSDNSNNSTEVVVDVVDENDF